MELLIATKNPGKFNEILELMSTLPFNLVSLADLGIEQDFDEIASTFEENALGKARFYSELTGLPAVADDSGLFVEVLMDELGLKTRRWGAGASASDEEWLDFFMHRMKDEVNRSAKFVCAAAYVNGLDERVFLGETEGEITYSVEAPIKPGIPLSSVFKPAGYDTVFAVLSSAEKNKLSHRGRAFQGLIKSLQNA